MEKVFQGGDYIELDVWLESSHKLDNIMRKLRLLNIDYMSFLDKDGKYGHWDQGYYEYTLEDIFLTYDLIRKEKGFSMMDLSVILQKDLSYLISLLSMRYHRTVSTRTLKELCLALKISMAKLFYELRRRKELGQLS